MRTSNRNVIGVVITIGILIGMIVFIWFLKLNKSQEMLLLQIKELQTKIAETVKEHELPTRAKILLLKYETSKLTEKEEWGLLLHLANNDLMEAQVLLAQRKISLAQEKFFVSQKIVNRVMEEIR